MNRRLSFCWIALLLVVTRGWTAPPASKPPKIQYTRDIQPLLSTHCFACHGPDEKHRKAGLRLDLAETALRELRSGNKAIVPGNVKASELVTRILSKDDDRMPPAKHPTQLKESDKELLRRWVEEGAAYQRHWAFVPPQRPPLPTPKMTGWAKNPIDLFLLARMEAEGLRPSPEADRYELARRVAIDLTGLPPSLEMVDRFVKDPAPDAYEKFVDQVLQSPAYGERWAQVWLDLARYADSNGYANDNPRTIWMYRDWVIDALNANKPFDQFTIEQIAGDLLPKPTTAQLLATAFHRNTLSNDEGGTNDEEFRVAAVVDRVNTTMQVWMGMTMGCAQCHNHKYDPLSQEEFYRLFAIFNQSEDSDASDNRPLLTTRTPEQEKARAKLDADLAALEKELERSTPELTAAQKKWEASVKPEALPANLRPILALKPEKRTPAQQTALTRQFRQVAPELKAIRDRLAATKKQLSALAGVTTPIMRELPPRQQRKTHILVRGNFLDKDKEVTPGVPAVFHPLAKGQPANRLTLAQWLVDPANPLTARVTVNRFWEQIFGLGLVETPEDFGIRGKLPTHPELLDWLAVEFMAEHWDMKKLLRLMVTSAAYRQSSRVTPALLEKDPNNQMLARGPRFRSSAEIIRDQALWASGLLSTKMHGAPVRPPRPKLGLNAAFGGATDWEPSQGDDRYRRALYTTWRRTTPYPSLVTFDAPSRNVCTISRPRTNTPLQALVTMNDPAFVEAAQGLARRMAREGGPKLEDQLRLGFRLALTRPPRDTELKRLVELYQKVHAELGRDRKKAEELATQPLGKLPPGLDTIEAATLTVVANVMLNLDEIFMKR